VRRSRRPEVPIKAAQQDRRRTKIRAPQQPVKELTMTKNQFRQKSPGFSAAC
jgi:hypothetical protein